MRSKRLVQLFAVLMLLGAVGGIAAPIQAASSVPTMKILSVLTHVDAIRFASDPELFLPSGMYAAAVGGAFEIDAIKSSDGSIALWQIRRDANGGAHRVKQVTPPSEVNMWEGLPGFFSVTLRDSAGESVSSGDVAFCPGGGYGLSRTDASGPDTPTYPFFCGSDLTRGAVWGIDKGWASSIFLIVPAEGVEDGDYTLSVRIADTYRRQLGIASNGSSASIGVTITTEPDPEPCPPEDPFCFPPEFRSAASTVGDSGSSGNESGAPAEGPRGTRPGERKGTDGVRHGSGGLPNLASLPAHNMFTENSPEDGRDYLDFGATIWNAGSGPLVVEGFRSGPEPLMAATQVIYKDGSPSQSKVIGSFEFDEREGHHHWHMEDVAQYDLLDASGNQTVLSGKQSFCLAPTDPIDLTGPGALWQPDRTGLWSACAGDDAIWLREVLPAGWGDTYFQFVAGQSFDITDVPNGNYFVRVTTNPFHRIIETTFDDNSSLVAVELGGRPGDRTVTVG